MGAAADVRGGAARRAGRQRVRRRHPRGGAAGRRVGRGRDRFTLASYPFQVSRAGAEHLGTPPDSVHSLTHFYNWSFSHVRTSYSMKWDGDMVLTREGVDVLRDLSWQLEDSNAVVAIPRHPMSVESEHVAWLDLGYRFLEPWVYPMGPEFTFVKAFEWEVREFPATSERIVAPEGLCVELKWLDQDEFAHWSTHRLRRDPDAAQAPRVGGLHRAEGGPRRVGARPAAGRVAGRCARHRLRDPDLAAAVAAAGGAARRDGRRPSMADSTSSRGRLAASPGEPVEPGRYDRVAVVVRDRGEPCGRCAGAQGRPVRGRRGPARARARRRCR